MNDSTQDSRSPKKEARKGLLRPWLAWKIAFLTQPESPVSWPCAKGYWTSCLQGSTLMRHRSWGLLSSKFDNPTHKYSFHCSWFYIWITKRINAQMPLSPFSHPREEVGRVLFQQWLSECAAAEEEVVEYQNSAETTFLPPQNPSVITMLPVTTLYFNSTFKLLI